MKIGNPSAGNQKSGVVAPTNPFKKVMNEGAQGPKGPQPQAAPAGSKPSGVLTAPPGLKKLPGGVTPLTAQAPRPALARPTPSLRPAQTAAANREAARAHAHAKAENLVELRAQSAQTAKHSYDTRLVDLIVNELKVEFANERAPRTAANTDVPGPVPSPPQQQAVASVTPISQAAAAKNEAEVKAASAVELIEKIEAFVKSQRPGIAITLNSSLGARVEIERLGPKEVAIRLVGKNGPPAPEDIGRIREEMRARGLKVAALSVA